MGPWPSKVIPLNTGIDGGYAGESIGVQVDNVRNGSFTQRGGISPRIPAVATNANYIHQMTNFTDNGYTNLGPSSTLTQSLAGQIPVGAFAVRARNGEYAAWARQGRIFVNDTVGQSMEWQDKRGFGSYSVKRGPVLKSLQYPPSQAMFYYAYPANRAFAGVYSSAEAPSYRNLGLATTTGVSQTSLATTMDISTSAKCGNVYASVWIDAGTNKLCMSTKTPGSNINEYTLAMDGYGPGVGAYRDQPVICCDQDSAVFFVAYISQTAGPTYAIKILKVNTAGAVLATATPASFGATVPTSDMGYWISNSSVAANQVVFVRSGATGVVCVTYSQNLVVTVPSSVTITSGGKCSRSVVCGAVDATGHFIVWRSENDGLLRVAYKQNATSSYEIRYDAYGKPYAGVPSTNDMLWHVQHQPISIGGRVLVGISYQPGQYQPAEAQTVATWMVLDITDVHKTGGNSYRFSTLYPLIVARGTTETSYPAWKPFAAYLDDNTTPTSYDFGSIDFVSFGPGYSAAITNGTASYTAISGMDAALALNTVTPFSPQYAHFQDSTIFAGSMPRMISQGNSFEAGWACTRPLLSAIPSAGATLMPAGSFTFRAVWKYIDDAGQVHRSEPSLPQTVVLPAVAYQIACSVTGPVLTEKDKDRLYIELYMSPQDPSENSPLYFYNQVQAADTVSFNVVTYMPNLGPYGEPLYTAGDTLENQTPRADGGVHSVGERCWISDGYTVFASKLPAVGEPPQWHIDGPLSLSVPASAGRIIGLSSIEEKLLIFCERGIFVSTGAGPDNTAAGQDFLVPERISDMGLANQRSVCRTPAGVFFSPSNSYNSQSDVVGAVEGVLAFVAGNLTVSWANQRLSKKLYSCHDIAFIPEREVLIIQPDSTLLWYEIDMRANQCIEMSLGANAVITGWGTTYPPYWASVKGCALVMGVFPLQFKQGAGTYGTDDYGGGITASYSMALTMSNLSPGDETLAWGRIRSATLLGNITTISATTITAESLQDLQYASSTTFTLPGTIQSQWPTGRMILEWRLPQQKCARLDVTYTSTPATTVFTAIEVQGMAKNRNVAPQRK